MSGKQSRAGSQGSIGEASALGIDEINLGEKKGSQEKRAMDQALKINKEYRSSLFIIPCPAQIYDMNI